MKRALWTVVLLSLLPALVLVVQRIQAEGADRRVAMVMDELALLDHANAIGRDPVELALHYQELGLEGIAVYEETPESMALAGRIAAMGGFELRGAVAASGEVPPSVPSASTVVAELEQGALDPMLAKLDPAPAEVEWAGLTWHAIPGDVFSTLPMGPAASRIERYAQAGLDIAYRPRNHQLLGTVGGDFPSEANYLVHAGLEVAGQPDLLSETIDASQSYLTGIIEGTEQSGLSDIAGKVPTIRLLSFNQDYINTRLRPHDLIDKYLLAANERNVTLLYLRPYTEPQLGNLLENTEDLVSGLRNRLASEGYEVGPLRPVEVTFDPSPLLRGLSALGILAGLGLLVLAFPAPWGALVSAAVLLLGLAAAGLDWDALALSAALVFPVLGYAHARERLASLGVATLISLAGAALLVAVGSDAGSMSGVEPFRGVAATLVIPPALFLFHFALRYRRPAEWVRFLWNYPVRVGDVVLVVVAMAAVGLVLLRRGNFPLIGATEAELALREWLAELFVRPRFKELLGHSLAVLGLTGGEWPAWIRGVLLTGGVIAQATILNSFSHYHTPVLISLQRTVIALVLGLVIGLLLVPLARMVVRLGRRWLVSPAA